MKRPILTKILRPLEVRADGEMFEPIATGAEFLFERIVSYGHVTPPGVWLDQPRDEWVVLLAGAARLRFELGDETIEIAPGDALLIPAHCRHRVEWTEPGRESVWLALHFRASTGEPTND